MLDRYALPLIRPVADASARVLVRMGIGANTVTWVGFSIGMLASFLIATEHHFTPAIALFASRICDALDGAVARQTQTTDAGAFLDITLDFLFYASVPLAFAIANPSQDALPAAVLLTAFIGTGSSFLAFATLAAKRGMRSTDYPTKSFYFLGGLTEGTETLACFAAMCAWPQHFAALAYAFAGLCAVTTATRIWWGWKAFG